MKAYIIIILIGQSLFSCSSKSNGQDKRKKVINEAIVAISKYDTTNLFKLIDTSYYFDTWSKELFLSKISLLQKKLNECGSNLSDTSITIKKGEINTTQYILPFCSDSKNNSFDLVIIFADYSEQNIIMSFNIKKDIKIDTFVPTKPVQLPSD
jgi:hypothetical protein